MKKHLLIVVFLLLASVTYAENTPTYCDLYIYQPNFKRYLAEVNYSEAPKRKFDKIKDKTGKKIRFETKMDALNYMVKDGWELVSTTSYRGDTHFYLKKG